MAHPADIDPKDDTGDVDQLRFEDRVASLVMGVLYSASHIEVTARLGELQKKSNGKPNTAPHDEALQAQAKAATKGYAATYPGANVLVRGDTSTPSSIETVEDDWVVVDAEGSVLHGSHRTSPNTEVSEIDMDTTATAVIGDTIYVACNFKIRKAIVTATKKGPVHKLSMKAGIQHNSFEYAAFNEFSDQSLHLVAAALRSELRDMIANGDADERDRARALRHLFIIGPARRPMTAEENALPHAEMQLLSYCLPRIPKSLQPWRVGVSRPCCPTCAKQIDAIPFVDYSRKHGDTPRNWTPPEKIETKLLKVILLT